MASQSRRVRISEVKSDIELHSLRNPDVNLQDSTVNYSNVYNANTFPFSPQADGDRTGLLESVSLNYSTPQNRGQLGWGLGISFALIYVFINDSVSTPSLLCCVSFGCPTFRLRDLILFQGISCCVVF
jgi:hypothetical protein